MAKKKAHKPRLVAKVLVHLGIMGGLLYLIETVVGLIL